MTAEKDPVGALFEKSLAFREYDSTASRRKDIHHFIILIDRFFYREFDTAENNRDGRDRQKIDRPLP